MDFVKMGFLALGYLLTTLFLGAYAHADSIGAGPGFYEQVDYQGHKLQTEIYFEQNEFRGCVMYLEGLGDSIRNHDLLFSALSEAGYRTVTFDYYGQGGSTGAMNETRLESSVNRFSEIKTQAKAMWKHFSAFETHGHSCATSPKLVIGWSTGGLAAYELANERWAKAVVLLAPGIVPNMFVGEAAKNPSTLWHVDQLEFWPWRLQWSTVISTRSLTRDRSVDHVDMPRPRSPMEAKLFAINLILSARHARKLKIDPSVKGLAFLSGATDSYVDSPKTAKVLAQNAPHFKVKSYPGALHELDNELPEVRHDLVARTIRFFNTIH